jgi:hypothetical protein
LHVKCCYSFVPESLGFFSLSPFSWTRVRAIDLSREVACEHLESKKTKLWHTVARLERIR